MLKKKLRKWKLRKKDDRSESIVPNLVQRQESEPEIEGFSVSPTDDRSTGSRDFLVSRYTPSSTRSESSSTATGAALLTPQSNLTGPEDPDTPESDARMTQDLQDSSIKVDDSLTYGSLVHPQTDASPRAVYRDLSRLPEFSIQNERSDSRGLTVVQKYVIHAIASPDLLRTLEAMMHSMRSFVSCSLQARFRPDPETSAFKGPISKVPVNQRSRIPSSSTMSKFAVSLNNALVTLETLGGRAMAASLEQAFGYVEELIRTDHFSMISLISHAVVSTEVCKAPLISRMLLKHIYRMSLLLKGPTHAYTQLAQSLLVLVDIDLWAGLDSVVRSWGDFCEEILGPEDIYTMKIRSTQYNQTFKLSKNKSQNVDALLRQYGPLLDATSSLPHEHVGICSSLAGCLEGIGAFHEAEKVYSSSPARLDQIIQNGALTVISASPFVRAVTALGKNMAWQGKLDEARAVFAKAVDGSIKLLGPDHPTTIEAIADFGQCLSRLHLDDDAQAMYLEIDQRLAPYVLSSNAVTLGQHG